MHLLPDAVATLLLIGCPRSPPRVRLRQAAGNTWYHPTRVRAVPLHDPDGTVRG